MGIKRFFKKVGGWFKDKFHKVKDGVTKFAKAVLPVAKKIGGALLNSPLGDKLNGFLPGAKDAAKSVISLLPDGKVKERVNEFSDQAFNKASDVANEINKRQEQARDFVDRGREVIDKLGAIKQNM